MARTPRTAEHVVRSLARADVLDDIRYASSHGPEAAPRHLRRVINCADPGRTNASITLEYEPKALDKVAVTAR